MVTMTGLLRLILLFWACYYLIRIVTRWFAAGRGPDGPRPEKTVQGEDMVRDPQCGVFLPRSQALRQVVDGELHYFCSEQCRRAFLDKP
jgi:YHS domain-containing protein